MFQFRDFNNKSIVSVYFFVLQSRPAQCAESAVTSEVAAHNEGWEKGGPHLHACRKKVKERKQCSGWEDGKERKKENRETKGGMGGQGGRHGLPA